MDFFRAVIIIFLFSFAFAQSPWFDGDAAFELLEKQVDFGPRHPGTEGQAKMVAFMREWLEARAHEVIVYSDSVNNPISKERVEMRNILARFNPERNVRIMLMAHWDTRQICDHDPDSSHHNLPVPGANDGASGTAILLQIATVLQENPLQNIGIDLFFSDGEDMGHKKIPRSFGLGTFAFAKKIPSPRPSYAVLLDMVGDAELRLPIEQYSWVQASWLVQKVWGIAAELGFDQFEGKLGHAVFDDHKVLYDATKIPAINIIDFEYPNATENYWHTIEDTVDKCAPESLFVVGSVVLELLYREDANNE